MGPLDLLLHSTVALDVLGLVVRAVALAVVPVNRRPSSAMAWLILIFALPYVGIVAFLLIGSPKLPADRRRRQREVNRLIAERTAALPVVPATDPGPDWLAPVVALNRELGALPLVTGNRAELIEEYDASLQAMTDAVDAAERFVHVEFYILASDATTAPFFAAMERAVQRGVPVRVLYDHVGSLRVPRYRRTVRHLRRIGVQWRPALPVQPWRMRYQRPDLRNHRKLLVVDGEVAFVGSQNLIDRSYLKRANVRRGLQWQELMVRLEGPIVGSVNAVFTTDWHSERGEAWEGEILPGDPADAPTTLECQVVPSGPGFDNENNLRLFNTLIYNARRRVSITSPYFVPDESLLHAVTTAAQRGLDVELFVSEIGDQPLVFHAQRSYYEALLRAGVRIWRYPAPSILHAKHLTIDDEVSVIGSSNMDMRSFDLNMELSLLVSGRDFAQRLGTVQDHYRALSRELTLEEHRRLRLPSRVLDNLARLTSALQ
ncbi:cardiolipin synthase [Patulibacter brassicae]|uniref:Cardiolipin synthase n=1 Tax=Patulibacter brassicae TaxID=1705717 RepID=A0ABU4VKM5_9ACTN|nr:cardiolipin synthase [Patulibacter brassicae]MDX8152409.1 cardiolipin synthase [Patulibacter brassicae]